MAKAKVKKPSAKGGLGKWFGEDWRDVKTGKACGRKSAKGKSKRPYLSCLKKPLNGLACRCSLGMTYVLFVVVLIS